MSDIDFDLMEKAKFSNKEIMLVLNFKGKVDWNKVIKEYIAENQILKPETIKMIQNGKLNFTPSQRSKSFVEADEEYFRQKIKRVIEWDKANPTKKDKVPKELWKEYHEAKSKKFGFEKKGECERCGYKQCKTIPHHLDYLTGHLSDKEYLREICDDCHKQVHKLVFTPEGEKINVTTKNFSKKKLREKWKQIDTIILRQNFLEYCRQRANAKGRDIIAILPDGEEELIKSKSTGNSFTSFLKKKGIKNENTFSNFFLERKKKDLERGYVEFGEAKLPAKEYYADMEKRAKERREKQSKKRREISQLRKEGKVKAETNLKLKLGEI